MASFIVQIAPANGVSVPERTDAMPVEAVYTRVISLQDEATGAPSSSHIQETIRGVLDAGTLRGTLTLEDVAAATPVALNFLNGSGARRLQKTVTPNADGAGTAMLSLTAADVTVLTAAEPQPPPQVDRQAFFVPVGTTRIPFETSNVQVAPVSLGDSGWRTLGLDKLFHTDMAVNTSVPWSGGLPTGVANLTWTAGRLAADGQFSFSVTRNSGDAWLWWLSGPLSALGIVIDDLSTVRVVRIGIALPPFPVAGEDGTTRLPTDVTEVEVATNPQIYTEDPGEFCRPFKNPERVLGERSFFTILRAEQPVISAQASVKTDPLPILTFSPVVLTQPSAAATTIDRTRAGAVDELSPRPAVVLASEADAQLVRLALPSRYLDVVKGYNRGRAQMDADHPVQWEGDANRYQATTVARGHILELRMRWRSNGYSLGTVAKTLTLAPRQTKRIQKIDWQRSEFSRRQEQTRQADTVSDSVTRDRDYQDSVEANLSEWARGESESSSKAGAVGAGFAMAGFVIGGGGTASSAESSSSQEGGRQTSASEEQRLRDSIRRYGDALRRLDSVVVNEVTQQESVTGTTEVVRNANYGHALTVIYYQILRHLKIETGLAGVRECLFVPFAITPFTVARAYRWREFISRGLRDSRYGSAIGYLKDVLTNFAHSDVPPGRRSDQPIRYLYGSAFVRLAVERPKDKDDGGFDVASWMVVRPYLGSPALSIYTRLKALEESVRDPMFQREQAPVIAANWVNTLQLYDRNGTLLPADFTLATRYQFNGMVRVDFTVAAPSNVTRETLSTLRIKATAGLPPGSVGNMESTSFTYETDQFQRTVNASQGVGDLVSVDTGAVDANGATIGTIPDAWERRDVRGDMIAAVQGLVEHLNEHVEYYHKVVWWYMDRDRLFMLIDGFYVPGTNGVSIASVVERDPIAIIGNSIVFRVSAGAFLGLGDIKTPAALYNYYANAQAPSEPMLVSLPTDGLYAQTVMDECMALEEHFGNTDWVLNDPDPELGDIAPELLATRRAEPSGTLPAPMPQTLINLQNAPDAPAPTGLGSAFSAVTTPNAFRDMAGLAGTQANAAAAMQAATSLATTFGTQAAALKMAQLAKDAHAAQTADQKLASVQRALDKNLVSPDVAQQHASNILDSLHPPAGSSPTNQREAAITQAVNAASASGKPFTVQHTTEDSTTSVSQTGDAEKAPDAGKSEGDSAAPGDPTDRAPIFDSWPFTGGSSSTVSTLPDFEVSGSTTDLLAFNSPEHFAVGQGLQEMIDAWAQEGLISGGAFIEDSDDRGLPIAIDSWKIYVPDRSRPTKPYDDFPVLSRAHWHWIAPDAHRDSALHFWTADSLRAALKAGKAVTLSIGDIVMLGGDLVGEFAEFGNAASANWRPGPVNIAKGISMSEPFAMCGARLLQFPRSGLDQLDDKKLLERNMKDYAGLKAEIASGTKEWKAVQAVVAFLRKVRGPTGCSELLVLSRMMRKEIISLNLLRQLTPWVSQGDVDTMNAAVQAAGYGDMTTRNFSSELFQFVVTNGYYAELAMNNAVHFNPDNWTKFEATHTLALQKVESQVPVLSTSIEYGPVSADAVAQTAYGLHFLSDAFSSGHMRTPRKALGREGALLAGIMHDFDNQLGLVVENGLAQKWRAFGDGYLDNLKPAQRKLLDSMSQVINGRSDANKEAVITAMASAMKQLHYQAQKHFGDTANAGPYQAVLAANRGNEDRLKHDDAMPDAMPGDGGLSLQRDNWIAMDIPSKITYLRKHQPIPLADGSKWRAASANHYPLVELDSAGNPLVEAMLGYRWATHWSALNEDRTLIFQGERDFQVDMTKYLLMANNTPDGALSWLGVREAWLPAAAKTLPEDTTE